ncbi:kinase-like domain-containing protein [Dactylonectria macrodidyma]|uniref:Kinase-like domain-containing protein n=1 Tax=Dactylonectria macrodidyma TaxID=307937 RepID=A0A9P9JRP0_9HYPO|nr:kinase-like domain-containing protein [Dactylonectria macrodidyma]
MIILPLTSLGGFITPQSTLYFEAASPQPTCRSSITRTPLRNMSEPDTEEESQKPPTLRSPVAYWSIPGSWHRREHPGWPEWTSQMPENVPSGTVCHVTKGKPVGFSATAHVERLPSGHVVKYPRSNPYSPTEEEYYREDITIEAEIYQRLGDCPYIPRLIDWDPESCCLTMEYFENGDLAKFMKKTTHIPADVRQRWALQAAYAVKELHGADVIHCDMMPRNFMLTAAFDLRLADFAGSSVDGSAPTVAAGPRFSPPVQNSEYRAEKRQDIFALGSLMYFIMVGNEPFAEIPGEDVVMLFKQGVFPNLLDVDCRAVIQGCWDGTLGTAEQVIGSLTALYEDF